MSKQSRQNWINKVDLRSPLWLIIPLTIQNSKFFGNKTQIYNSKAKINCERDLWP